jgi:dipeptidyl aminopeptidase/acylaminoacyl peptidase
LDLDSTLARVVIQRITYLSDGLRVRGYLVEPVDGDSLPAVIYNRGGNRDFGAFTDTSAVFLLAPLAAKGYVVAASQYRGNMGGEGQEEFGGADVNDVLNLLPLLDRHARVDSTRIGMYGWSRGGMMTYLALARTNRIRAAVVGAGAADAFINTRMRPEMAENVFAELVPNWNSDRDGALASRSAVRWADRLHKETPILLLHGSADWRVHPTEALGMANALFEAKHPFRMIFYEGGDHGLNEFRREVDEAVLAWLDRYVRDRAPLPNLEPHGR